MCCRDHQRARRGWFWFIKCCLKGTYRAQFSKILDMLPFFIACANKVYILCIAALVDQPFLDCRVLQIGCFLPITRAVSSDTASFLHCGILQCDKPLFQTDCQYLVGWRGLGAVTKRAL